MKRARGPCESNDHGSNSGVTTQTDLNKNSKSNAVALEEIRAKLEQARMKKSVVEKRLLRQRRKDSQLEQQQKPFPQASTPTKATSTMTGISTTKDILTSHRESTPNSKITNSTRAQEAHIALDRARSKLQGALQYRERALSQMNNSAATTITKTDGSDKTRIQWNRKHQSPPTQYPSLQQQSQHDKHNSLPPISALSQSLQLTEISRSGPPNTVYHFNDNFGSAISSMGYLGSREALIAALGGKEAVEALHQGGEMHLDDNQRAKKKDCENDDNKSGNKNSANSIQKQSTTATSNHNLTCTSLVQRKLQLQNELMALKEKLEMKSPREQSQKEQTRNVGTPIINNSGEHRKGATKESLERRKAEAQTVMDISYWRHFVSKQEHLLEQVTAKINNLNNDSHRHQKSSRGVNTYKECLHKRHINNKAIAKVQNDLDIIEKRLEVVEDGIVLSTQKLLDARQALHEERIRQMLENNKTETPAQSA